MSRIHLRAAVACAIALVAFPAATSAQDVAPQPSAETPLRDASGISIDLALVPVSSSDADAAALEVAAAAEGVLAAVAPTQEAERDLMDLVRQENELGLEIAEATARFTVVDRQRPAIERSLQALAVAGYVRVGSEAEAEAVLDPTAAFERASEQRLTRSAAQGLGAIADELAEQSARSRREIDLLDAIRITAVDDLRNAIDERSARVDGLFASLDSVPSLLSEAARRRATSQVVGVDEPMPLVVLDAYWSAAETTRLENPFCRLDWELLAGLGWKETIHGSFPTGSVDARGQTRGILGPVLDGETDGIALVEDTDDGELDGDDEFDRAIGPMQFIPETWGREARDGNGDGVADPDNLYDASLASATKLCRSGDLGTPANRQSALFGYNASDEYVRDVVGKAAEYGRAIEFEVPPTLQELWPDPLTP